MGNLGLLFYVFGFVVTALNFSFGLYVFAEAMPDFSKMMRTSKIYFWVRKAKIFCLSEGTSLYSREAGGIHAAPSIVNDGEGLILV